MKKNKKNIVYSTNPDFTYEYDGGEERDTLPNKQQQLRVYPDKTHKDDIKAGLLFHLAQRALLGGFIGLDPASWKRP